MTIRFQTLTQLTVAQHVSKSPVMTPTNGQYGLEYESCCIVCFFFLFFFKKIDC